MKKLILIIFLTLLPLTCYAEEALTKVQLEKRLTELQALLPQIEQVYTETQSRIKEVTDLLKLIETPKIEEKK